MRHIPALIAAAGLAAPALAQTDRIIDTTTGWGWIYGATSAAINTQISGGSRPFCIERVASGQYDTVFVSNAGSYAVAGTQVLYGSTAAGLSSWLSGNNLRLLELEPYDSGGSPFVTAIGVPNSGATATPGWGYLLNVTFAQVASWLNSNPTLRLIDLDAYRIGGTLMYSAVAVPNTGANFQSGWWYGGGMTSAQVTSSLTTNGARLICLEVENGGTIANPSPTFACVMVSQNPGGGWWSHGLDSNQVAALLDSTSSRLTCLKRYTNHLGQTRWAAATVDNANTQTRRMRSYIWGANSGGSTGFMLKEVGGPVLASNNINFVWEPCSTVKLLHGIYAIYQCSLGNDALANDVLYRNLCAGCPFTWTCANVFRDLTVALQAMLEPSDNFALIALERRYGVPTLNAWADSRGFGNIQVDRQTCDCGVVLNTATCADFSELLEQASDGTLFNSTWEDTLHDHMNDLRNQGYGIYPTLSGIITQEAASTDLTASEISQFRANMEYVNKGGNYGCGTGIFWRTEGGWASIPFKASFPPFGWIVAPREYVFSLFAHNATDDDAARIVHTGKEEILREQIREALQSWDNACDGPVITNQPDPLAVNAGQNAQFQVVAAINPEALDFTWYHGVTPLANGPSGNGSTISGATTGTLTITGTQPGDAGTYFCRLTTSCGFATSSMVALTVNTVICYANCDGSTTLPILNVADFACFLNRFAAGDSRANCDNSTSVPVLNVADFSCFLNRFAAGCT